VHVHQQKITAAWKWPISFHAESQRRRRH